MANIYELWEQIRNHPDFAGGALFTRESVAQACFNKEPGSETPADIAGVSESMMIQARITMDSFIFSDSYSWEEAFRENVCV